MSDDRDRLLARSFMVRFESMSEVAFEAVMSDREPLIRANAVRNGHCPQWLVLRALWDIHEDIRVRRGAVQNPLLPDDYLWSLVGDTDLIVLLRMDAESVLRHRLRSEMREPSFLRE